MFLRLTGSLSPEKLSLQEKFYIQNTCIQLLSYKERLKFKKKTTKNLAKVILQANKKIAQLSLKLTEEELTICSQINNTPAKNITEDQFLTYYHQIKNIINRISPQDQKIPENLSPQYLQPLSSAITCLINFCTDYTINTEAKRKTSELTKMLNSSINEVYLSDNQRCVVS